MYIAIASYKESQDGANPTNISLEFSNYSNDEYLEFQNYTYTLLLDRSVMADTLEIVSYTINSDAPLCGRMTLDQFMQQLE